MPNYKHSQKQVRRRAQQPTRIINFVTPDGDLIGKTVSYRVRRYQVVCKPLDKKKDPKVVSPGVLTAAVYPVIGFCSGYVGYVIGLAFA